MLIDSFRFVKEALFIKLHDKVYNFEKNGVLIVCYIYKTYNTIGLKTT